MRSRCACRHHAALPWAGSPTRRDRVARGLTACGALPRLACSTGSAIASGRALVRTAERPAWFVAACVKVPARACTLASAHVLHAVPVACCSLCADVPKPEMPKVGGTLHAAVEAAVPSEILPLQPMLAQEFTMNIIRLIPCPFINQCARQAGHGLWELNPGATCGGVMQLCCAYTASLAACHLRVGPLVAGVATCRAALRQQQQESSSHKSTGPCVW